MRRLFLSLTALFCLAAPAAARAQGDQQTLVDRATLSIQEMMTQGVSDEPQNALRNARGVMICPRIFKAGFIIGGEGGGCVLLARAANGTWSYPSFYGMGSGSVGLQIGIQDSSLVMMIMTERGLNAVMDSQFKLGANASIAVATVGGSVQGATTAAVGADIVAFEESRGLFGGVALEGSIMSLRSDWNQAYYGQPYAARQVVVQMVAVNRGADPLREVLTRYGSAPTLQAAAPPPPPYAAPPPAQQGPGYAPAYPPPVQQGAGYAPAYPPPGQGAGGQPVSLQPSGPIQQQSLPPPPR